MLKVCNSFKIPAILHGTNQRNTGDDDIDGQIYSAGSKYNLWTTLQSERSQYIRPLSIPLLTNIEKIY